MRYIALLLSMAVITPARAQSPDPIVIAGKPVKVYRAMNLNPDCSSSGDSVYRIIKKPQHGSLSVKMAKDFAEYPASNSRHVCNTRASSAVRLWYTPAGRYTGMDEFAFTVIYPSGTTEQRTIRVNVVP